MISNVFCSPVQNCTAFVFFHFVEYDVVQQESRKKLLAYMLKSIRRQEFDAYTFTKHPWKLQAGLLS